jgi:hypothetical protein
MTRASAANAGTIIDAAGDVGSAREPKPLVGGDADTLQSEHHQHRSGDEQNPRPTVPARQRGRREIARSCTQTRMVISPVPFINDAGSELSSAGTIAASQTAAFTAAIAKPHRSLCC